jgi:HEAT repeat protein
MDAKSLRRVLPALSLLALGPAAGAQLELPRRAPAGDPGAPRAREVPAPPSTRSDPASARPTAADAARFVFEAAGGRGGGPGLYQQALASLAAMGPEALVVGRMELAGAEAARLELAVGVLCGLGAEADLDLVAARLMERVPASVAERLLELYLARDPTRGSPEFLTALLEHPTGAMRAAGERALLARAEASFLPALERTLGSARPGARAAAVEGLARLFESGPTPATTELLVGALADDSAKVAWRAAELLAGGGDAVEARLLEVAFSRAELGALPAFDRRAAYALLALVEREDRLGKAILLDDRVPLLLTGLESDEPVVSGAAAAALAGIGYRSREAGAVPWLDRDVPHRIVKVATGDVFHTDLTSVQRPCLRRLARITGEDLGAAGAAWQAWWSEHAESFHATRAFLTGTRADAPRLLVRLVADGRSVVLAGRDAVETIANDSMTVGTVGAVGDGTAAGEGVLALSDRHAAELFDRLEELGLLGAERLSVGGSGDGGRVLEVELAGARKRFQFPARATLAQTTWFDDAEDAVRALARENRWQSWFDPAHHPTALAFGRAQAEAWEAREPLERERAFKDLVLARLAALAPGERNAGLAELGILMTQPGVASGADYGACRALLADEASYGPRVLALVDLLLAVGSPISDGDESDGGAGGGAFDPTLAVDLVGTLTERFGEAARPALERVLARAPGEVPRALAGDPHGWLRALAAGPLAASRAEADVRLAIDLARDADPGVAAASIEALGANRVEAARAVLEEGARSPVPTVRKVALVACAELGGGGARELALEALGDPDAGVAETAFGALSELADPRDATLFAAHLARGAGSATFDEAVRAFRNMRDAGEDELARLCLSKDAAVRRQAALILGQRVSPGAFPALLRVLSEDSGDAHVATELAILSCRDLRRESDPALAWWEWWDGVVHDDALAWLLSAAEQAGFASPGVEAFAGEGTRAGALWLLELLERAPFPLSDRAARELAGLLDLDEARLAEPADVRHEELLADIAERFGA